jgi:hypothetical protein
MSALPLVRSLDDLLAVSAACESFKTAVRDLAAGRLQDRILFRAPAPPVKVQRVVMKLLEACPELPLESVEVRGVSGCSSFRGTVLCQPGGERIEFFWDCHWQAAQLGWTDHWGEPDQARAARELGYQCFVTFTGNNEAR